MKKKSTSQPVRRSLGKRGSVPARRSVSQGGFFNLRVLIGLFVALTGVSLVALGGLATKAKPVRPSVATSSHARSLAQSPGIYKVATRSGWPALVPPEVDCSKIRQMGIDKMENLRAGAIMIFCGEAKGGGEPGEDGPATAFTRLVKSLMAPLVFGGTDVDLITGTETSPHITQSETFTTANPDNPLEIVVAFNDSKDVESNPINISGASASTDGGVTFTRLIADTGRSPFDNTVGDPVVLYNKASGEWFTVWIGDGACGGGLGGYKSSTPWDPNSWTHYPCVHKGFADDRESGWADNNPSSPFFGRMYVSWNDYNVFNCGPNIGSLFVTFSSDNGNTWHSPVQVCNGGEARNTQITGDMAGSGDVYIAGMDEGGGGFPHNDINRLFKSTDGGVTWTNPYNGPSFPGPGVTSSGYFACMFNDLGA